MKEKSQGLSNDARRQLMEDLSSNVEDIKTKVHTSFQKLELDILDPLTKLLNRLSTIKEASINHDGTLAGIDLNSSRQEDERHKSKPFAYKVFKQRESLLSNHLTGSGFRTLENIFIAFLILLGFHICINEYFDRGSFVPDLETFFYAFGQLPKVCMTTFSTYGVHLFVVPLVQMIKANKGMHWIIYMTLYGWIQLAVYGISLYSCYSNSLPPASAMIVSCEMARVSMKTHAYFREKLILGLKMNENMAKFLPEWAKRKGIKITDIDEPNIEVGSFSTEMKRFVFFFFAPTLVYRDEYVRTKEIRFNMLIKHLITFFIIIFY